MQHVSLFFLFLTKGLDIPPEIQHVHHRVETHQRNRPGGCSGSVDVRRRHLRQNQCRLREHLAIRSLYNHIRSVPTVFHFFFLSYVDYDKYIAIRADTMRKLPVPDVFVFLHAPVETCMQRIAERNRVFFLIASLYAYLTPISFNRAAKKQLTLHISLHSTRNSPILREN